VVAGDAKTIQASLADPRFGELVIHNA
jgi:hypothetical protein